MTLFIKGLCKLSINQDDTTKVVMSVCVSAAPAGLRDRGKKQMAHIGQGRTSALFNWHSDPRLHGFPSHGYKHIDTKPKYQHEASPFLRSKVRASGTHSAFPSERNVFEFVVNICAGRKWK